MDDLSREIVESLGSETIFKIGKIAIKESVVVTWIIMFAILFICALLVRNFKVKDPGKKQLFFECAITKLINLVSGMLGEEAKEYTDYIATILLYIAIANIMGIFGLKPPTEDFNVTAALAIMSIILIQYAAIRKKGPKGWLKGFAQPMAVIAPINILELIIKPLSLCMRLFGNIMGASVVMKLVEFVLPVGLPVIFGLYFDLFDGLIQAYIFVFLTSLFIREAVE